MREYFYKEWQGETYLKFNDDPDLQPRYIKMKQPPPREQIDGWGLKNHDQKFRHQVVPDALVNFTNALDSEPAGNQTHTIEEIFETIAKNQHQFRHEIEWIKTQHRRIEEGYWTYINGDATHMASSHYAYNNYWDIGSLSREDGLPEYRLRDQVFYQVFDWAFYEKYILGLAYYKHRREGATSKIMCDWYFKGIRWPKRRHGMQSQSDAKAEKTFMDQMIIPWSKLPIIFRPRWSGTELPSSELVLRPPTKKMTSKSGSYASTDLGMDTVFNYGTSAVDFYDGYAMEYYYGDEFAKRYTKAPVDTYQRHTVVKDTMIQGDIKRGFCAYTSTVGNEKEDGDEEGGIEYAEKFYNNSKYWELPQSDMFTASGVWPFFISAEVNLEGFNDEFGNPIIEDPVHPVKNEMGSYLTMGSRRALQIKFDLAKKTGTWKDVNETHRKHPVRFIDCFRTSSDGALFDQDILVSTVIELEKSLRRPWRIGRLEPVDPAFKFGDVKFVDDDKGKWYFSQQPPPSIANKFQMKNNGLSAGPAPVFPLFASVSVDPVQFAKGTSKLAITVKRLPTSSDNGKLISEWEGDQFVADYITDVSDIDEASYEAWKACRYFSTLLHGEKNVDVVNKYFLDNNMGHYLSYEITSNGKISDRPGFSTQTASKQINLSYCDSWVKRRGRYDKHIRILKQMRDMRSADQLKKLDLVASALGNFAYEQMSYQKFAAESSGEAQESLNLEFFQ